MTVNISNDLSILLEKFRYEVQYVDYGNNEYTAPVILTKDRAERIMNDNSIRKVRFTQIIGNGSTFEFEHQYLTMSK